MVRKGKGMDIKLNLGCGKDYRKGWLNVDRRKEVNADQYVDLSKYQWDFPSNTFDFIYASHIIEHLPDKVKSINEIWRIAKPGAIVHIRCPHFSTRAAFTNPEHKHFFGYDLFRYFSPTNEMGENQGKAKFRIIKTRLIWNAAPNWKLDLLGFLPNMLAVLRPAIAERFCYLLGGYEEVSWYLEVVK